MIFLSLTHDHQQFVVFFDDVDLEHRPQTRDVSQRVFNHIQSVETLLRAHQHDLTNDTHFDYDKNHIDLEINIAQILYRF